MHLLGKIVILLGLYKLCIFAIGDCFTDLSPILEFICKDHIVFAKFQHKDCLARWLTSFNYNHTLNASTLSSTDLC